MKRVLLIMAAAFMFAPSNASAQVVEEGNVIIDAYYGFPNLYTTVFKAAYANSGSEEDLKIGGLGPLGGRVEYMLADKIGLGLDVGYNDSKVTYTEASSVYNETTMTYDPINYDYDFKTSKLGVMVTFNYHFLEHDALDAYAMVGAGYGKRTFSFESTNPNYSSDSIEGAIPVAFRLGVGMRYFFTDNIGLNMSVGIGQGGIANGGISFKF